MDVSPTREATSTLTSQGGLLADGLLTDRLASSLTASRGRYLAGGWPSRSGWMPASGM